MLILSRNVGQSINVSDDVEITVLGVKGHQVRIGIVAPRDLPVHREEIYKRIQAERIQVEASAQVPTNQEPVKEHGLLKGILKKIGA